MVRNHELFGLHQYLQYHVVKDSRETACQLLSIFHDYVPALQLALDMFHRLQCYEWVVEALLSKSDILTCIRYIELVRIKPPVDRLLEVR